jgi:hypothetical protein
VAAAAAAAAAAWAPTFGSDSTLACFSIGVCWSRLLLLPPLFAEAVVVVVVVVAVVLVRYLMTLDLEIHSSLDCVKPWGSRRSCAVNAKALPPCSASSKSGFARNVGVAAAILVLLPVALPVPPSESCGGGDASARLWGCKTFFALVLVLLLLLAVAATIALRCKMRTDRSLPCDAT